jgi:glycerate-2-kinase
MNFIKNFKELIDLNGEREARIHVLEILEAGVESVLPENVMKEFFKVKDYLIPKEVTVFGWGKASFDMFAAFRRNYKGKINQALIITSSDNAHHFTDSNIKILHGSHPIPDKSSLESGEILLDQASKLGKNETLVCLISGGGSSMFEAPKEGIDLTSLQEAYMALYKSGCDIHEMNSVRRALSKTKGGGLAREVYPAKVKNIIISDVPGNDLEDIASGATVLDPNRINPIDIIDKFDLKENIGSKALKAIRMYQPVDEKYVTNVESYIIADNQKAVNGMLKKATELGYIPTRYDGYITGDVHEAVNSFMNNTGKLVIGGGETTLKLQGKGKGGRNQEFVLSGLKKLRKGTLASIGTDGIDGNTIAAGAIVDERIWEKVIDVDQKIDEHLSNNDSYRFFQEHGGSIITGPTGTNVADICVYLNKSR